MRKRTLFILVVLLLLLTGCAVESKDAKPEGEETLSSRQIKIAAADPYMKEEVPERATEAADLTTTEDAVIPEHEHNYVAGRVVEPTCSSSGYTQYVCTVCGAEEHRDITKATKHIWSKWKETQKPTCAIDGLKTRSCTVCGVNEVKTLEKTEHRYSMIQTIAPTDASEGYDLYRCSVCSAIEKRNIQQRLESSLRKKDAMKAGNDYIQSLGISVDTSLVPENQACVYSTAKILNANEIQTQTKFNQLAVEAVKTAQETLAEEYHGEPMADLRMRCYIRYYKDGGFYAIYCLYARGRN